MPKCAVPNCENEQYGFDVYCAGHQCVPTYEWSDYSESQWWS